ncbi:UNVERIFIED_CONTAM: hypothetical protein FKN15_031081 [Acipenser sinensis]
METLLNQDFGAKVQFLIALSCCRRGDSEGGFTSQLRIQAAVKEKLILGMRMESWEDVHAGHFSRKEALKGGETAEGNLRVSVVLHSLISNLEQRAQGKSYINVYHSTFQWSFCSFTMRIYHSLSWSAMF